LIQWNLPGSEIRIERLLAIDGVNEFAYCIDIQAVNALPILRSCIDISTAIADGLASPLTVDPFADLLRSDDDFSEADRFVRNRAWPVIQALLSETGDDIYIGKKRGRYIRTYAAKAGVTVETLYIWLRRYWQRGQSANALLGSYKASGRQGPRPSANANSPKRGRRSIAEVRHEKNTGERIHGGINMTAEFEARCRRGIDEFFLTRDKLSLKQAYHNTMAKHFVAGFHFEGKQLVPIALPQNERPTYSQFRNLYYRDRNRAKELAAREGKAAASTRRPRLGTSFKTQFGPGKSCEIDATLGDTELVHHITRMPIGRPTIYRIHDDFSGMILAIHVSFEPESWASATLAIYNMVCDKVEFCRHYGIEIEESDWPSHYMCREFRTDNGSEWKWYASDNIPGILGVAIHNVIAYRGDLKPIVEATHHAIKEGVDRGLPGNVIVKPNPGERDFRREPVLDLYQYTQLQIRALLDYNRYHRIKDYPLTPEMIAAGVQPYPLELWRWGEVNLGAYYQDVEHEAVWRALLPREDAMVTGRGIRFRGFHYAGAYVLESGWIEQAAIKEWEIKVAYEPNLVDYIYLPLDDGRKLERCELTERWQGNRGQSWVEVKDLRQQAKANEQLRQEQIEQGKIASVGFRDSVLKKAATMKKAARQAGISSNQSVDTQDRQQGQEPGIWNEIASSSTLQPEIIDMPESTAEVKAADTDVVVNAPQNIDLLTKARRKKQENEK
jgi:putative transposase